MKKDDIKKQPWFFAIKGAQRDLIKIAGGIDRVAMILEVSVSLVGTWNNREDASLMPLWAVMALETDVERSVVSRAAAGHVGAKVLDDVASLGGAVTMDAASVGLQMAVAYLGIAKAEADADGYRSASEIALIRTKFREVKEKAEAGISACDADLARKAAAEGGE